MKKMLFSILNARNFKEVPSASPMNRFKRRALKSHLRLPNLLYLDL